MKMRSLLWLKKGVTLNDKRITYISPNWMKNKGHDGHHRSLDDQATQGGILIGSFHAHVCEI
jgi:hypothetical protein